MESISKERLREILHEKAVSLHADKSWMTSIDPDFHHKVGRIREFTDWDHNPPIVGTADKKGPVSLEPYRSHTWAAQGHPDRVRETYKRTLGVCHLTGTYAY